MESRIASLQQKFKAARLGAATMTLQEVEELIQSLEDLAEYMNDRGDKSMAFIFNLEKEEVRAATFDFIVE